MSEVHQYARDVVAGEIVACKWVRLACERHLRDLERDDIYFDEDAAERFFKFCRFLRHYKGPMRGQAIELLPWQKFAFGSIYGWKWTATGAWRFNYFYLEIPRKNGKTTISAAVALYDAEFVERTGAEVFCLATKEDQAKLLYNDCCAFIRQSRDLAPRYRILDGKNLVYAERSNRTSFIKPLGSDSKRLDGLNPISAICDELHAWPHRDLWDVVEDAFGGRENWHMGAITTAGTNTQGICFEEREHLTKVLEGEYEADNKFGMIYTVDGWEDADSDSKDDVDWNNEVEWAKANPNMCAGKSVAFMRDQATKSAQVPAKLATFKTKQLNIWLNAADAWITRSAWMACKGAEASLADFIGHRVYAGLDLSSKNDLSALILAAKIDGKWRVSTRFWKPKDTLADHAHRDKAPYEQWVRDGHLLTVPGPTIDYAFIAREIANIHAVCPIHRVAFDRWKMDRLQRETDEIDLVLDLVEFGQGFKDMSPAINDLEDLIATRGINHGGNPVLNMCASNATVVKDPSENKKFEKRNQRGRIDGIVGLTMAIGAAMKQEDDTAEHSVYEERGFIEI
ncbi:terminase large subunit [Cerasicoccus frondis]|uniref:terminase large subunit n=1 Tax=Cerasicoccus frondis TaxID=490090 RepID=UPI002852A5A8|nr:terminase TerL endonuclease subunit [Cerasicoccus frondis]